MPWLLPDCPETCSSSSASTPKFSLYYITFMLSFDGCKINNPPIFLYNVLNVCVLEIQQHVYFTYETHFLRLSLYFTYEAHFLC